MLHHAIELETVIPGDGKLPEAFQDAFGRKARVIVLLPETNENEAPSVTDNKKLMAFAGTIDWPIDDPLEWQRGQRDEWE